MTEPNHKKPEPPRLTTAGRRVRSGAFALRAENTVELAGEDAQRMQKLLDVLEDLDDVQEVYHNAEMEDA